MRVDSCSSCLPPRPSPAATPASAPRTAAAVAGQVRSSSMDVTVMTADGDRVTLSASQSASIGAVATSDGRRAATSSSESTLSLTVEGSLDRGELRDLRKVMQLLARAAADQDSERLARRLTRPDLADNIASVQASYAESVAVIGGVLAVGTPVPAEPTAPGTPVVPEAEAAAAA